MSFRACPRYGVPGSRFYEVTGNPDGQRTVTIDITMEEAVALEGRDIEVSIEIVKSITELLREARRKVIQDHVGGCPEMLDATVIELERLDAEFMRSQR